MNTININCPCGAMALIERQASDPANAVKIIMACPDCSDRAGGSDQPFYYDKNGKIIDLVSVGRL